jgi:2-polyprenyl-6-methoxyphenol hydroxylase-like FAD-dependent oxidoreductase
VGGGITGLTLACALASYGVAAVLLDEDNTVGVKGASSRGICYTQKSLEIFHRLGVYEPSPPRASSGAWAAPLPAMTRSIRST